MPVLPHTHNPVLPRILPLPGNTPCRYKLPESQVASAVEAALELVNLKEFMHRATHTLSGGQRQRVAIAGEAGHMQAGRQLLLVILCA
jgi:ABC-type nitrate/sulfonate/bicarbonate transport system ATPase subunit